MSHSEAAKLIIEFYVKNDEYKFTKKELKTIQIEHIEPISLKKVCERNSKFDF